MTLGTLLLIVVILLLIGAIPTWVTAGNGATARAAVLGSYC